VVSSGSSISSSLSFSPLASATAVSTSAAASADGCASTPRSVMLYWPASSMRCVGSSGSMSTIERCGMRFASRIA
jgi:hypothetical protein